MNVQGKGAVLWTKADGTVTPVAEDCCCGGTPPPDPVETFGVLYPCDGSGDVLYAHFGTNGGVAGSVSIYWHFANAKCYYAEDQAPNVPLPLGETETPESDFAGPIGAALLSGEFVGCDHQVCVDGIYPDPGDPPDESCGCGADFANTTECDCEPDTIRVTINGVTLCGCIGDCGDFGTISARVAAGQVLDGTYDMLRGGPGEWFADVFLDYEYSLAPDPGNPAPAGCSLSLPGEFFTIWLKKVNATDWQFAVRLASGGGVGGSGGPHGLGTAPDQPVFLFKGSGTGSARSCLFVPTMTNESECGFVTRVFGDPGDEATACYFFIGTDGTASFDGCPPA